MLADTQDSTDYSLKFSSVPKKVLSLTNQKT